jgi:N-methylhydantoinase B
MSVRVADAITAEIIRNGFTSAALEMNRTMVRTAFSPLLYEALDFGVGIVSPEGEMWADAPGVAGFCVCLPAAIQTGLAARGRDWYGDGDIVIHNDPYLTGTHISDTCIYVPVFHRGELVAFAISMAHWADIGGKTPGGWCPDSTDVYQEGLCFSHQKLVVAGVHNDSLFEVIQQNVRIPETVMGDLDAQIAACKKGAERVVSLCQKYGSDVVSESMEWVMERTAASVRAQIAAIPDGVYSAATKLDHDGVEFSTSPTVSLTIDVSGCTMRVSFEGSSPATLGPVNEPEIGARADVCSALKGLLMPLDPTNGGHFRPVEFRSEPGLIVSPQRPSPCDSYGYVGVALVNLVFRAMSAAVPERCPAGGYQLFGASLYRVDPRFGEPFVFMGPISGGDGARPFADGPTLVFAGNGDTPNTPVEVIETRFPVRVEQFEIRRQSAGAGEYRGGYGVMRDMRLLEPGCLLQMALENHHEPLAAGLSGGRDGAPSWIVVNPSQPDERTLTNRVTDPGVLARGDVIREFVGGGGGWGHPFDRSPTRVLEEVRDDLLTPAEARDLYGVVVTRSNDEWRLDEHATHASRSERTRNMPC